MLPITSSDPYKVHVSLTDICNIKVINVDMRYIGFSIPKRIEVYIVSLGSYLISLRRRLEEV